MAVIALLLVGDVCLRRVFVPAVVSPRFNPPSRGLRDRTAGKNLAILFALAAREIDGERPTMVVVGDSTVSLGLEPEEERLTTMLQMELARQQELSNVQVLDFSAIGLPVAEASVLIAKSLALGAGLTAYAMTPRIMCALDQPATDARRYLLDWGVPSKIGLLPIVESFPLGDIAESAIRSHWALVSLRNEINTAIVERLARYAPPVIAAELLKLAPVGYSATLLHEAGASGRLAGPLWTRAHCPLQDQSPPVHALTQIFRMCQVSGRCLLYEGPLNPDGAGSFDPGLAPEFAALVARLARQYGVSLLDYRELLAVPDFRPPSFGHVDAIHMTAGGRRKLSERLSEEAAVRLSRSHRTRGAYGAVGAGMTPLATSRP